jgi:hypothetical protein
MRTLIILLTFTIVISACKEKFEKSNEQESYNEIDNTEAENSYTPILSIISLIATPEKYHQKKVKVIGYLNIEFEINGIYLHTEDYERGLTKNAIWVRLDENIRKQINDQNLNQHYVLIQGIFDMENNGHGDLYNGEISQIDRITLW